ncbi:hypothetical protein ZEAMMB73_Zm00001d016200 [Zea mays]|uniref:Uncharacterized protein n=1 Tax=Zea mays TaxID=4577 RepID=A0A1D6H691_MAIZE|nr:hypothetical protein ZEAMMB73_Zm00001d016200 [Zea mays]
MSHVTSILSDISRIVQVRSFNRHLRNGLLRRAGACGLPCGTPQEVQVPRRDSAQGDQGGLHEVVPGQVRRRHPQQGSGQHVVNLTCGQNSSLVSSPPPCQRKTTTHLARLFWV